MNLKFNISPFGAIAADNRKRVRSFDVFDTLIARRCIEPVRIFEQVGAKAGIPDFAAHRRRAELAVATSPYTLHDIYRQLALNLGLTETAANEIKAWEIAAEMGAVIPIAENMEKVNDGDLLLSDMYLDRSVILDLLAKAGLKKKFELFVSSDGKRSGALWSEILKNYSIERHLGDNRHSDIAMPAQFGIESEHTSLAAPTAIELQLSRTGLRDLAVFLREARLAGWHEDSVARRLQMVQVAFNFPILVLASVRLFRLARQIGVSRLLFASRDCNLWLPLARMLALRLNISLEMEYFYTSRKARLQPSMDYLAYARDRWDGRSLLIDICGSGWSGAKLLEHLEVTSGHAFFIHHLKPVEMYEAKYPTLRNCTVHSIIGPAQGHFSNPRFEMCNYAEHPSVIDIRFAENREVDPVYDADERPEAVKKHIKEQKRCFEKMIELLENAPFEQTLSLSDNTIAETITMLYAALSKDDVLNFVYNQSHRHEDTRALREMGLSN